MSCGTTQAKHVSRNGVTVRRRGAHSVPGGVAAVDLRRNRPCLHRQQPRLTTKDRVQHRHELFWRKHIQKAGIAIGLPSLCEEILDGDVEEEPAVRQLLEAVDIVTWRQVLVVQPCSCKRAAELKTPSEMRGSRGEMAHRFPRTAPRRTPWPRARADAPAPAP